MQLLEYKFFYDSLKDINTITVIKKNTVYKSIVIVREKDML